MFLAKNNSGKFYLPLLIALLVLLKGASVLAQTGKYGATTDDSIKCVENLSVYKDFLGEKNYERAYGYWQIPFAICPGSSLKMYVDGEDILEGLIEQQAENPTRRNGLIDTLLLAYDIRIAHFNKEGYVLGKKGAAMFKYNHPGYEKAYQVLKKSMELDGNSSQPAVLIYCFQAALKVHEKNPKTPEFWLTLFNHSIAICDYNITNGKNEKLVDAYATTKESIVTLADPFLTCDILIKYFGANYEEKKVDADWLKNSARIMNDKNCTEDPLFFKLANTLHSMNPSAESAKNMGIMSVRKSSYNDAVKFFSQALDLANQISDESEKSNTLSQLELLLAKAYFGQNNYAVARTHAQKAASYKDNWGEPYMLIGDIYAGSVGQCTESPDGELKTPYWVAVDMYVKAKAVDQSLAAEASQKIARFSQYFPEAQAAFFYGITEGTDYTVKCWINAETKVRFR